LGGVQTYFTQKRYTNDDREGKHENRFYREASSIIDTFAAVL